MRRHKKIIADPQIYEYFGEITRGELDNAAQYVHRKQPQREKKIEQAINANTSTEYVKSNSAQCNKPGRSHSNYHELEN